MESGVGTRTMLATRIIGWNQLLNSTQRVVRTAFYSTEVELY